ncbi:hypothetical protein SteCoe_4078 [Stentor coeruleus]|uniref:RING-type domain-containing protein n=1 Tax=Stentor coeruleus TaxID=5963 RepID=A0A1R2CVG3_9CILI|nr:hypothetical protein SteCoe_4078 [Stentor coeruleus]
MECPVCFALYDLESNQAVKLLCCHTVCKLCINLMKNNSGSINCPQCFKITSNINMIETCQSINRILLSRNQIIEDDARNANDEICILIRNIKNRFFELKVNRNDTVKKLKELVKNVEGIDTDAQWLLYNGRGLQNEDTIRNSNIRDGHIISLVVRSFGG